MNCLQLVKKLLVSGVLAGLLLLPLVGCGGAQGAGEDRLTVYTSFYPVYDFAAKVAGDHAKVVNMIPSGTAAHDWEPGPRDITGLAGADVFVYSGAGMEFWVDRVLESIGRDDLVVVEASAGFALREEEPHGHEEDDEEDGHGHGGADPHVWLSPKGAAHQMMRIFEALSQADPDNAEVYQDNLSAWLSELVTLDEEFRERLSPLENKTIVVSHKAFGYLCGEYGLEQVAAMDYVPEGEPTAARLAGLVEFARENPVKVVFYEASGSSKVAEVLAGEIGAETAPLYPLEFLTGEQAEAGEDYFSLMRRNLEAIANALE